VSEQRAHANLPLESFFDLVFVLAFTQVTEFLSQHLSWLGLLQGGAILAALWWVWATYAWLTDGIEAHEDVKARVTILSATAMLLVASLAVPRAFASAALLFAAAYAVVRLLHVALYLMATDEQPRTRQAILRLAPGFIGGSGLLLAAAFVDGPLRAVLWAVALTIDYGVTLVLGVSGFSVHARHFVERHQLIIILALGESIVAIGTAAHHLTPGVVLAAVLATAVSAALWWTYFDEAAYLAGQQLADSRGSKRANLARDAYSYLHLPMVAGIIFLALGLRQTLADVAAPLGMIPAVALSGGAALFLVGLSAFQLRITATVMPARIVAIGFSCAVFPVATSAPALAALALLAFVLLSLVVYETAALGYEARRQRRAHRMVHR
jgi:low temperature requirement protein LtrA